MNITYTVAYVGGSGGTPPPPPETEKLIVEKGCFLPELYKLTEAEIKEKLVKFYEKVNFPERF